MIKIRHLNFMFHEPYRIFFPLGSLFLSWGALVWLPLIWGGGDYPIIAHRYLMLNGFVACFIAGFLMTAIPRFSQTDTASKKEVCSFLLVTLAGLLFAYWSNEKVVFLFSSLQAFIILIFMLSRIRRRKENPPFSFIFIFVGLLFWFASGLGCIFFNEDYFKQLHYEGAITSIILGVGSRLIPGILGHVSIVQSQRKAYEQSKNILSTVPVSFILLILTFISSYFFHHPWGAYIRALAVTIIAFKYWRLWLLPVEKTALTFSIWMSCWFIVISFFMKAIWQDGLIHIGHSFFISGIVLLSLLVATRVLQSHGPQDKNLENSKTLYVVTGLLFLAAATRVSAYFLADRYLSHLAYSSIILVSAITLWSFRYLRLVVVKRP